MLCLSQHLKHTTYTKSQYTTISCDYLLTFKQIKFFMLTNKILTVIT